MNEHDRDNLDFLLSLNTSADWDSWAEHCSDDDFIYALELLKTAQAECMVQYLALVEDIQDEEGLDCTEANDFINRVKKEIL